MKKITFFLCALFISAMSFAETATLSSISTKNVATQSGASVSTTFGGVTCTVTKNSGNQPGFYTSSGIVRYYAKDVMTLSVESGYAITRIDFTMNSGSVGTASPEGLSSNTWTGNAESVSFTGGNTVKISKIVVTYEAYSASDVIVKTLKSIAVEGMTTTYEQGDIFRFDGTCTATYSVVKNDVDQEDETKPVIPVVSTPNMEQMGTQTITVSYTDDEVTVTTTYDINVIENTVTAGTYSIVPNNDFWGTNFGGSLSGDDLNKVYTGKQDDITIQYSKGKGAYLYINNFQTRTYEGTALTISVPTGYVITDIAFTADGNNWEDGQTANVGTMTDSKNWAGSANSVAISFGGKCRITKITVTYEELADDAVTSPTISGADEFIESTEVTISAEDGLKVYYTLDGTDPTNASTEYTAPFELTATTTVKAVAYDGEKASGVSSKTFKAITLLTCKDAAELALSVANNNDLVPNGPYAFRGFVTNIAYAYQTGGTMSVWMADTKNGGKVIQAYKFTPEDGNNPPVVGDYLQVVGELTKYNTTPESAAGAIVTKYPAPVVNHTITVSANPAEGGTVTGTGEYEETDEITVKAVANDGYEFVNWTENEVEVSTDAEYTFEVLADRTLVANFEKAAPATETVYFVNALNWTGTINAYAWDPTTNAAWPGVAATKEAEQIAGYDVYSYTAEAGAYKNIIFNGTGGQTADLVWTAGKYYVKDGWYTKEEAAAKLEQPIEYESVYFVNVQGWSKVNIYTWTPEVGGWPGVAMTKEDDQLSGYDVYSYTVEKGTAFGGMLFNNADGVQTGDLVWTAGKYYVKDGWYTKEEAIEKLAGPVTPPVISYVLMGVAGDWTTGIALTANPDNANEYVLLDQTISEGDAVKVVTLTDGVATAWCGNVDEYSVEHSADDMGNIVLAPGKYDFYYKVTEDIIYIGGEAYKETIAYELNGGELPTATVPTQDSLIAAFKDGYNAYFGVSVATTRAIDNFLYAGAAVNDPKCDVSLFMKDDASSWKWLGDYVLAVTNAQIEAGTLSTLKELATELMWRQSLTAFFLQQAKLDSNYKGNADFTEAGKPEAWGAAYQAAHAVVLPTEPVDAPYTLPTPVKDGFTFVGWYDNAEGTGEAYTVIPAGWSGTLYAIWKQSPTTALENIAVEGKAVKAIVNGQLIIIKNGVQYNAQGAVVK